MVHWTRCPIRYRDFDLVLTMGFFPENALYFTHYSMTFSVENTQLSRKYVTTTPLFSYLPTIS